MMMKISYHLPVLLEESIDGLNIHSDGDFVDATFGGGGHSFEILKNLSNKGSLISFDQDPDSIDNCFDESNFYFVCARRTNAGLSPVPASPLPRCKRSLRAITPRLGSRWS